MSRVTRSDFATALHEAPVDPRLSRPDVDASLALDLLDRGLRKLDSDLIPLRWL